MQGIGKGDTIEVRYKQKDGGNQRMKKEWDLSSQKLGILLQNFADMIWEYDIQTHALFPEPEAALRCGLPDRITNGAQGLVDTGLLHPDYLPALSHLFHSLEVQDCTLTAELLARLGTCRDYHWYRAVFTSFADCVSGQMQAVGFFQDIDYEVHQRLKLQHLANMDSHTGIYNAAAGRQLIQNNLMQQSSSTRNAMFVFDIDNFKVINDTYGHCQGDEILHHFATILRCVCRKTDTVYRIGGDEFGLFAYNTDDENLVQRICSEILRRTRELSENCIPVSVSIGAAVNKEYAPSYFDYYRAADKAMYQAKENGKGNFVTCCF